MICSPDEIVIMDNSNIHIDVVSHSAYAFPNVLKGFDLKQLITFPAHKQSP